MSNKHPSNPFLYRIKFDKDKLAPPDDGGALSVDCLKSIDLDHLGVTHAGGSSGKADCVLVDQVDGMFLLCPYIARGFKFDVPGITTTNDQQSWYRINDHVEIGWCNNALPDPTDLHRPDMLDGWLIPGRSGREWSIPIARTALDPVERCTIPMVLEFDQCKKPIYVQDPEFDWVFELSGQVWEHFIDEESQELKPGCEKNYDLIAVWATQILGINYRIGPHEITAFSKMRKPVIDRKFAECVCMQLIDWPFLPDRKMNENEKKNGDESEE